MLVGAGLLLVGAAPEDEDVVVGVEDFEVNWRTYCFVVDRNHLVASHGGLICKGVSTPNFGNLRAVGSKFVRSEDFQFAISRAERQTRAFVNASLSIYVGLVFEIELTYDRLRRESLRGLDVCRTSAVELRLSVGQGRQQQQRQEGPQRRQLGLQQAAGPSRAGGLQHGHGRGQAGVSLQQGRVAVASRPERRRLESDGAAPQAGFYPLLTVVTSVVEVETRGHGGAAT